MLWVGSLGHLTGVDDQIGSIAQHVRCAGRGHVTVNLQPAQASSPVNHSVKPSFGMKHSQGAWLRFECQGNQHINESLNPQGHLCEAFRTTPSGMNTQYMVD